MRKKKDQQRQGQEIKAQNNQSKSRRTKGEKPKKHKKQKGFLQYLNPKEMETEIIGVWLSVFSEILSDHFIPEFGCRCCSLQILSADTKIYGDSDRDLLFFFACDHCRSVSILV